MIIGIGHQREVGKDLAGNILAQTIKIKKPHLEVRLVAFADPLYEIAKLMYGWLGFRSKEYYDQNKDKKDIPLEHINTSPRDILIKLGTPAIRHQVWDETWLQYTMNINADLIIITDVRFPNEAQEIRDRGGKLIKIMRPSLPEVADPTDPDNQLTSWTDWDIELINDGTLKAFSLMCRDVAKDLGECLD